jgi:peptide-methionine (S)-S-oxide reductase
MWLNACVDGQLKLVGLEAELERLGLPEADRQRMRQLVQAALAHRRR